MWFLKMNGHFWVGQRLSAYALIYVLARRFWWQIVVQQAGVCPGALQKMGSGNGGFGGLVQLPLTGGGAFLGGGGGGDFFLGGGGGGLLEGGGGGDFFLGGGGGGSLFAGGGAFLGGGAFCANCSELFVVLQSKLLQAAQMDLSESKHMPAPQN
jgi:hypothetical protein